MRFRVFGIFIFCVILLLPQEGRAQEGKIRHMQITSPVFTNNDFIPSKYTCDGVDVSPQLEWSQVPEGVRSFVLIAEDPDASMGTWVHWVIYNIPAEARSLGENIPRDSMLEDGSFQGSNDFRLIGYGGPCPPSGKAHRYFFKLYALDAQLDVYPGAPRKDLIFAMDGHVLAESELIGLYKR